MGDDDVDSILARHKREQKELVAQITALKKTATKGDKTKRKQVQCEVERLERELKCRHKRELGELQNGQHSDPNDVGKNGEQRATYEQMLGDEAPVQGVREMKLDESPAASVNGKGGKPKLNRQKVRLAKRVAEMETQREVAAQEASEMPDLATEEQSALQKLFDMYDLREESVRPDGNCLYVAFASQLNGICKDKYDYKKLRSAAASYIRQYKDDFAPFLFADDFSSAKDIDAYCAEIEGTALWGGEMEITALSRAMNVRVEVYAQRSPRPIIIEPTSASGNGIWKDSDGKGTVRLAYYQHLFGLGQHYNGLLKR